MPVPQAPLQPKQTSKYWFVLGRQADLAVAEITAVLNQPIFWLDANPLITTIKSDFEAKHMINQLGGTIKIGLEMATELSEKQIIEMMVGELIKISGKKIYGLSFYNTRLDLRQIKNLGVKIKKELKEQGLSARFVMNKEIALSSATVTNNRLTDKGREFLLDGPNKNGQFGLAMTQAVQPFANFSRRDYGRPASDGRSGMLPPKLAMIMINLAQVDKRSVILDPFCGSGTVLSEAVLLGYDNLIGRDISPQAINNSQKNIDWTIKEFRNNQPIKMDLATGAVETSGAELARTAGHQSISAIITEPYLGRPLRGGETRAQIQTQITELKKLYLNAFEQFKKYLKKNGVVVIVIPRFKYGQEWLTIDCLAEIKKLGFMPSPLLPNKNYLLYSRPNQHLAREIWRFVNEKP